MYTCGQVVWRSCIISRGQFLVVLGVIANVIEWDIGGYGANYLVKLEATIPDIPADMALQFHSPMALSFCNFHT